MSRFVVIEGLDGAGTTTQTERLASWLRSRGLEVEATREPTDGPVGKILRQVLRAEAGAPDERTLPWLFAADRADHLTRTVDPALGRGAWVLSDRYYPSSLAYQSLVLPLDRVHALNADFRVPDLTLFLQVSVDTCLRRLAGRPEREIFEVRERLEPISASYERVMDYLVERGEPVLTLDGDQPVELVEAEIRAAVEQWLE